MERYAGKTPNSLIFICMKNLMQIFQENHLIYLARILKKAHELFSGQDCRFWIGDGDR
jgi:hypothetical protein